MSKLQTFVPSIPMVNSIVNQAAHIKHNDMLLMISRYVFVQSIVRCNHGNEFLCYCISDKQPNKCLDRERPRSYCYASDPKFTASLRGQLTMSGGQLEACFRRNTQHNYCRHLKRGQMQSLTSLVNYSMIRPVVQNLRNLFSLSYQLYSESYQVCWTFRNISWPPNVSSRLVGRLVAAREVNRVMLKCYREESQDGRCQNMDASMATAPPMVTSVMRQLVDEVEQPKCSSRYFETVRIKTTTQPLPVRNH